MMPNLQTSELDVIVNKIKKVKNKYYVTFLDHNGIEQEHIFTEDQMVEYRITNGKWFTFFDLEQIVKSASFSKWYGKCLNYIFTKPRTKKEIWGYLAKSDLEEDDKQKIINKLIEYKYLDDEVYTKRFIEECFSKCLGKKAIICTLERLGVDNKIIQKELEGYLEENLVDDLTHQYQKIQSTLVNLPIIKQKLKMTEKMARNGLSTSTISSVLRNLEFSEDLTKSFSKDLEKIKKQTNDKNKIITKLQQKGYTYDYIKRNIDV